MKNCLFLVNEPFLLLGQLFAALPVSVQGRHNLLGTQAQCLLKIRFHKARSTACLPIYAYLLCYIYDYLLCLQTFSVLCQIREKSMKCVSPECVVRDSSR